MRINKSADTQESWKVSDQPNYNLNSTDESYRALLAALDLGWQVEEPVYLRPRWNEGGERVFHFMLTKSSGNEPYMITTCYSQDIERFVIEEGWQVI